MKSRILASGLSILALAFATGVQADPVNPFESCVNINGDIFDVGIGCFDSDGAAPGNVEDNLADGLGTVVITLDEAGDFYIAMYVDNEIDEGFNTFFNEGGDTTGAADAGQSWEIDEPGFFPPGNPFGDIWDNFIASNLDNGIFDPSGQTEDDVAMALAWDFTLAEGETAIVTFLLSEEQPDGFFLTHFDFDSDYEYYFSSTLEIEGDEEPPPPTEVPEPGTLLLLGAGLLGLGASRRRLRLS